ncbi:hypothetical protein KGG77_gp12 [Streptomyces phage Omar]|uniref:DUF7417 domain-containing protein n=1 Tax=Streptomyces phage Omar TaxID=2059882 RepID=A0A2H5BLP7_9CAUD|nr:hypothetical protein KGG77_gp12 [Streptomyces phage Omar]AUG87256.1 hypothetical protein SEA_OMAR_72 [Streptomyces phage Omar]
MGHVKNIAIDLISYESGELDPRETLELFALLIKSGLAWSLQGSYGRTAHWMISEGWVTEDGGVTEYGDQMLAAVA